MATKHGDILPEDLIAEVLSWLPVKILIRFKCVCKSWYNMIASPDFVSHHLNNYYSHCNNTQIDIPFRDPFTWFFLVDPDETPLSWSNLPYHEPASVFADDFVGPCNGIFAVSFRSRRGSTSVKTYTLWNPAIKEFKVLPPLLQHWLNLPLPFVHVLEHNLGFGMDPITNDYKLVLIREFFEEDEETHDFSLSYPSEALVYSLAADSWKDLGELELQCQIYVKECCYTYLNGMYYWQAYRPDALVGTHNVLVSFDMAKDVFQEINCPDFEQGNGYLKCLTVYNDSIAVFVYNRVDECLRMWVMDGGSWMKKLSVGPLPGVTNVVGYRTDGQVFLRSSSFRLLLCDLSTGEIRDLEHQEGYLYCRWEIIIYKGSLVSIMHGNRHIQHLT